MGIYGHRQIFEEEIMDKDRVIGSAKQVKGAVKQAVGKAVGGQSRGGHCQSKFYTGCSRTRAGGSSIVLAHELPPRSAGLDAENCLYLFATYLP
jgi:hypothetical protein